MKKLLVIVGPTGTGKTDLGIELAKKFNGEIVSADSRQIYIGMDIGTGKIDLRSKISDVRKEEGKWIVDRVPIHLYDVLTPDRTFSVAGYQQTAYKVIDKIHQNNKLPILVGGTGLYVQAVVEGLKIPKAVPDKNLRRHFESQPLPTLVAELRRIDPETVSTIDKQNPRRIIRALEVYYQTGKPISELKGKFKVDFDSLQIGLTSNRDYLYNRVDLRIDNWFKEKFVEEVKDLKDKGYNNSLALTTLGYRQVTMYLDGKITLQEAIQRTKFEHHRYIRSQTTWFRKNKNIFWFDIGEKNFKRKIYKQLKNWLIKN